MADYKYDRNDLFETFTKLFYKDAKKEEVKNASLSLFQMASDFLEHSPRMVSKDNVKVKVTLDDQTVIEPSGKNRIFYDQKSLFCGVLKEGTAKDEKGKTVKHFSVTGCDLTSGNMVSLVYQEQSNYTKTEQITFSQLTGTSYDLARARIKWHFS